MLAPQKESIFGCSCRLWLLSWRHARVFARSCSLLSKYLPISWKQRKEQSHAQCHVTHRIRIFDKISEHVKVAKSVDIAVPELAVTKTTPANHVPGILQPHSFINTSTNPDGSHMYNYIRQIEVNMADEPLKVKQPLLESSSEIDKRPCKTYTKHSRDTKITLMWTNFPAQ